MAWSSVRSMRRGRHAEPWVFRSTAADEHRRRGRGGRRRGQARREQGLMIPASMGLRFQVPNDLDGVHRDRVVGHLRDASKTGEVDKAGRAVRRYQRTPVEIAETIAVADLTPGRTYTRTAAGTDRVCGSTAYDDARFGRRLIEIALCNDRETPPTIPVDAWLFQTKLHVDAGGAEVFLPVARRAGAGLAGARRRAAAAATCSTATGWSSRSGGPARSDWRSSRGRGGRRAVWTTWLPVARDAADAGRGGRRAHCWTWTRWPRPAPDELRAGLAPLVDGYRDLARRRGRAGGAAARASAGRRPRRCVDEARAGTAAARGRAGARAGGSRRRCAASGS